MSSIAFYSAVLRIVTSEREAQSMDPEASSQPIERHCFGIGKPATAASLGIMLRLWSRALALYPAMTDPGMEMGREQEFHHVRMPCICKLVRKSKYNLM